MLPAVPSLRKVGGERKPRRPSWESQSQGGDRAGCKSDLTFVEVKTRRSAAELDWAIDERRLARVAAAAELLMPRYAGPGDDIRVDVILLAPGSRPRHIENAWIG